MVSLACVNSIVATKADDSERSPVCVSPGQQSETCFGAGHPFRQLAFALDNHQPM
jgi:hypothetical protein